MQLTNKHKGKDLVYRTDDGGVVVTTIHKNGLSSAQHYHPWTVVQRAWSSLNR